MKSFVHVSKFLGIGQLPHFFAQQNTTFVQREAAPKLRRKLHHRGLTPSSLGNIASAADASVALADATDVWGVFFCWGSVVLRI